MKRIQILLLLLTLLTVNCLPAQVYTPQWQWAKAVGGNYQDYLANNINVQLDSAGNVYEILEIQSSSIVLGTQTFTNPGSPNSSLFLFAKYNSHGNVVWAKRVTYPPQSMIVDAQGNSYWFSSVFNQDTFRFNGLTAVDTTIHIQRNNNPNYGLSIAKFDSNGNIVSLKLRNVRSANFGQIIPYGDGKFLASVAAGWIGAAFVHYGDTIDGFARTVASYLAIMDTNIRFSAMKYIGYDSGSGFGLEPIVNMIQNANNLLAVDDQKSVYIFFRQTYMTIFDTAHIPVPRMPYIAPYYRGLVIKVDSLLNYKWYKTMSTNISEMFSLDKQGNTYFSGFAALTSGVGGDTVILGNLQLVVPIKIPYGQYDAMLLGKLDANGHARWIDTFYSQPGNSAKIQNVINDAMGNVLISGSTSSITVFDTFNINLYNDNLFVAKVKPNGRVSWVQTTTNSQSWLSHTIAEDKHGNIYLNGLVYYNHHPVFGHDTLSVHLPISSYPSAPDIFTARLGLCTPQPPIVTASAALHWCGTDSVQLSSSAATGYLWSTGDTGRAITAHQSGPYYVYTADTLGCYARSATDTVHAYPQPVLNATVAQEVKCKNGNDGHISLSTSSATGTLTYTYIPAITDTLHVPAGHYSITVTDMAHCTAHDTIVVTEPATVLMIQTDSISAAPAGTGVAIVIATGGIAGYTYSWSNAQTTDTIRHLSPGWYQVTVTDRNGCQKTDSVYIRLVNGIDNLSEAHITLYPNPTTSNVYISTPTSAIITIYDYTGSIMTKQTLINGQNKIDTEGWSSGIYIVDIRTGQGSYMGQIVVTKNN
jgi:hypothetical protein